MSKKIRVLFILEGLYGRGAERISLNLISKLDRQRFDPTIWVLRGADDLQDEVPQDVNVEVILDKDERIRHKLLQVPLSLLRRAREADVIVGTVELMPTYFAYLAGLLSGKPVIGWVRNSMSHSLAEQSAGWHRPLSGWVYPRFARLVFVSRGIKQTLAEMYPLREDRLSVIYNPINLDRIKVRQAEPLPEWAEFMTRRPTVLGLGSLQARKGFDLLIEAHAALRARGVEHDLLILGEGHARPQLEAQVRELGVQDSVHLPGFFANPYPFLKRAAAFALSSRYEGLANVILEAMACGTPVVSADCPSGPAEILENGRSGVLVPPENASALAGGLGRVLTDEALRRQLSEDGRRRVQDFASERLVPQWEHVLEATARRAQGRAPASQLPLK